MPFVSSFLAELMLWLMYLTLAVALVVTSLSVVKTLRMRTKDDEIINGVPQMRIARIVAAAFVACMVVTYLLGSSEPLLTNGVIFANRFWLKVADMFIYTSFILILGCLVVVFMSRFRN